MGCLALLVFAWLWKFTLRPPSDFDDAYMVLRYVHHVLDGQGLAWNEGDVPVYGVTSWLHFLWVLVLRWSLPWLSSAELLRVASGAAAVALLVSLVALAVLFTRPRSWSLVLWSIFLVPPLAFSEAFQFHAGTGMDTMVATLANTGVVLVTLQLLRQPTLGMVVVAAVASTLAVLARPENALPALLCPALALLLLTPRPRGKRLALFLGLCLGFWGVDVWLCAYVLGTPLPLAFYAKQFGYYQTFAGERSWNPIWFLRVFLFTTWPYWAAILAFVSWGNLWRTLTFILPTFLVIGGLFAFNQIMGHLGRFYFPLLPYVVIAAVLVVDDSLVTIRTWVGAQRLLRFALAGMLMWLGNDGLLVAGQVWATRSQATKGAGEFVIPSDLPELDSWTSAGYVARLAGSAPVGTTFAMSEHGLPGALAPKVAIVDLLGLHDPYVALHGFSVSDLFRQAPDILWMPHPDHAGMLRDIVQSPDFQQEFLFYPGAFTYGLALRKTSVHFSELSIALKSLWSQAYPGVKL
jgi:hypothetical protein